MTKIFCIGFQKTGTTSIKVALESLGYSVTGPNFVFSKYTALSFDNHFLDIVEQFDAFQDHPWPLYFKRLTKLYPDAVFIYTYRSSVDKWARSFENHFSKNKTHLRRFFYGMPNPTDNMDLVKNIYLRHQNDVFSHFKNSDYKFVLMDLDSGFKWEDLCKYLKENAPCTPFPIANSQRQREIWDNSIRGRLSSIKSQIRYKVGF